MEHQVVFIRQTDIKPEQHLAFAQAFGQLDEPHPLYPHVDGFDRIVKLENDSGAPPDTNSWHTDLTFKRQQPFASILVARSVPSVGGDTLWSSLYAAFDRLPEGMKADLQGLEAIHDMGDFRNTFAENTNPDQSLNNAVSRFGPSRPTADRPSSSDRPPVPQFQRSFCNSHQRPDHERGQQPQDLARQSHESGPSCRFDGGGRRVIWPCGTIASLCITPSPTTSPRTAA